MTFLSGLILWMTLLCTVSYGHPVARTPWQKYLYACNNQLVINTEIYPLINSSFFDHYYQCTYTHDNGDGSSSVAYCWYDYQNHTLYHYPNTPLPIDSSPSCPSDLPLAQDYLIKTASNGKCITAADNLDGSPLVIQDCDYNNGNPLQKWHFDGSTIQTANKCIDVSGGNPDNGSKLQVWTCVDGNANQQFQHWIPAEEFLTVPTDRISWMLHMLQCLDNTDGKQTDGNPVQIWTCDFQNPNQQWFVEPVIAT